jgi:hypothetical protein
MGAQYSRYEQRGGAGLLETGERSEGQQAKRACTTLQPIGTQPAGSLAADRFAAVLGALPAEDWGMTWAAGRTIMLRGLQTNLGDLPPSAFHLIILFLAFLLGCQFRELPIQNHHIIHKFYVLVLI